IFWYIIVMEQTYSDTSASDKIGVHEFLEALGLLDNKFRLDALKKLYRDREARQRLILLRLFTMRLPNLSEQAKNGLFFAFSRSNSFG
ncbi:10271_t:CDS:2, partial [Gigaspora margarita]